MKLLKMVIGWAIEMNKESFDNEVVFANKAKTMCPLFELIIESCFNVKTRM